MAKYARETIYNSDGSVRKRKYYEGEVTQENSLFEADTDTFSTPDDPPDVVEPLDPDIKFADSPEVSIEQEKFTIEKEIDLLGMAKRAANLLINTGR